MAHSCLHIYYSALPFTPTRTKIFETYAGTALDRVHVGGNRELTWSPLLVVMRYEDHVDEVMFSPDGRRIASRSGKLVQLWDESTGEHVSTLEGHSGDIWFMAFSPDSHRVATGSEDKTARLWDGSMGKHVSTLEGHSDHISSVAFSPDSRRVATGSKDKTVRLWDGSTGEHVSTLGGHSYHKSSVFSPDSC